MSQAYARPPGFGTKLCVDDYYTRVEAIISTLRPTASRAVISQHLNRAGFVTPRGLPWDRQRLANFMHRTKV
jgi:hypothetical protein